MPGIRVHAVPQMLTVDESDAVTVLRIEHGRVNALDIDLLPVIARLFPHLARSTPTLPEG